MSESKRKFEGNGNENSKKKKYRSDGTPIWGKRHVEGPGIWVSCVKGKEKQTFGEVYDIFESVASELWPKVEDAQENSDEDGLAVEDQIANELSALKKPRVESNNQRFENCQTNTPCVLFISCKPPVDPVELIVKYVDKVKQTGITRTRYVHRLVPVSGTCVVNISEIQTLSGKVLKVFFAKHPDTKFKYKVELRVRNHSVIPRDTLIQTIAQCVPEGHTVDLHEPEIFILVEVFKSICGISIVKDYYDFHKFNVMEIANEKSKGDSSVGGRTAPTNKPDVEEGIS